jgi:hypothetical protein
MFTRVLGAALPQVLRSVAWLLLPTSFIALLAWATAGSATGEILYVQRCGSGLVLTRSLFL